MSGILFGENRLFCPRQIIDEFNDENIILINMNVPFLSLHDVTAMHGDEIREAARRVIDSGWYLQGK